MGNLAYDERLENPTYELIDGEEIMQAQPSTNHARIAHNLHCIVGIYLKGKRCEIFGETMVYLDEKNHYIPDLIIVCDKEKIKTTRIEGSPDLVVEILSPSTSKRDMGIKKDVYEKFGVREYWVINPKEKSIYAYLLKDGKFMLDDCYTVLEEEEEEALNDKEKAEHKLTLKVSLYDDFEINVKEVFEDVT